MINTPEQSGTFQLMVSSAIFMLCGYIINLWLGRELGPATYGIYGIIISLMTAVNIIQTSGLPQATSKFIAEGKSGSEAILKASLYIQIVSTAAISLLFFIFAYPFALLLHDTSLTPYIQASSFILPFYSIYALYTGYYNGLQNFKRQALLNIIYSVSKLISVIGLVYTFHLYGAIAGFIISPIVAIFFGLRLPRSAEIIPKHLYKQIITFSLPITGFAVLSTLFISIDILFVKAIIGTDESAGLYAAAQNIARIPYFALSAFAVVLFPTVVASINNEDSIQTAKRIRESLRNLILILAPTTFIIAITSGELLGLLYSAKYLGAALTLSWLILGLGFTTIFMVLANVINASLKPSRSMFIAFAGLVVTAIFCYLLIPYYALLGASLATSIGSLVAAALALFSVARRFPKIIPWLSIWKISAAILCSYLIFIMMQGRSFNIFFIYVILSLVYGCILFLLREVTWAEIKRISIN